MKSATSPKRSENRASSCRRLRGEIRRKSILFALLFPAVIGLGAMCLGAEAQTEKQDSPPQRADRSVPRGPKVIALRKGASALEFFSAHELQRYVYLRTGRLLPLKQGITSGNRINVTSRNLKFCGALGNDLGPQQYLLKSSLASGEKTWWIVGGDDIGTLYGAYRFAEKLGVRFGLDDDAVPDELLSGDWPETNELGKPRFVLRGLQPFHDFSVGPDWWNLHDYQSVLSQMAKLRMNFIGLHTYPSWNPAAGPEANVWIGLPEDVDAQGNVRFGYEAGVVTTRKGWAVTPFPTRQYASGASLLFEADDYGPDFMLDCLEWPRTPEASAAMFNRYGDFQQQAFRHARRLGIKTCVGTELPLGVPKTLASRLETKGLKPDAPEVIQKLYEGTFLRLMRKVPIDYYWFWAPEIWLGEEPGCRGWEVTTRTNTERDLHLAEAAAKSVKAPFNFATCGWRLGTRDEALWMDKRTPNNWAASAINTGLGRDPVEKAYGAMPDRPKWVIGWAEDDDTAGAHCCTCWDLQLWTERMFSNSDDAFHYGCEGMLAIHWRTAAISPNITALAQAGWDFAPANGADTNASSSVGLKSRVDTFWADWGRGMFGGDPGAEAGRTIQKFDGGHLGINALVRDGAGTSDAQISQFFAPLRDLEGLRSRIKGTGNLERFDYWLNQVRASQLRVRTWILAARLAARMTEVNAIQWADGKASKVRKEVLPLRLELARSYEDLIASWVNCARSPGEIGTISSIESGSRARLICAYDQAIAQILGEPLAPEMAINTAYRGAPRIFVPAKRTQMNVGEPQEIRAFVLSHAPCTGIKLFWRSLGQGRFKKLDATHQARQAYRATLPTQSKGAVEYYLEASLDDGQKVIWPATAPAINQTVVIW
jgi:hypothetical protein